MKEEIGGFKIFPYRIHGTNGMLTYIFMVEFLMGSMWVNIPSSHGSSESMILNTCQDLVGTFPDDPCREYLPSSGFN